jgi:putative ABC transport system permease protein
MSGAAPQPAPRSGRRATIRWAVRLARREWRQQLTVLAMLTIAVGAAVAASAMAVNATNNRDGQFGTAPAIVRLDGADAGSAARIEAARQRFGTIDLIEHSSIPVPGSVTKLDLRDQDPHGPYGRPMLSLRTGRYPTAPGEAALTHDAAGLFDATIGSSINVGGSTARVVGIVENPSALSEQFALVAPGQVPHPEHTSMLVNGTEGRPGSTVLSGGGGGFGIETRSDTRQAIATLVLVVVGLALALVGLLATAGFAVLAQRRQRQLGMLAAIGAPDSHIRLVMIANGAVVGVVSSVLGGVLGVVAWFGFKPAIESASDRRIDLFHLPWTMIIVVCLFGVLAAIGAAWRPAHLAARVPIITAVSGRPIPPRPVRRSVLVGTALLAVGMLSVWYAQPGNQHVRPAFLVAGLFACAIGTVFFAPTAIRSLGLLAHGMPFSARLTMRDLARYQSRASAALAAIVLACGIAVSVIVIASANEPRGISGNLSTREMVVHQSGEGATLDPNLTGEQIAALDARAAKVIAALGTADTGVALDVALGANPMQINGVAQPVSLAVPDGPHSFHLATIPFVATPELLALYGIDPAVAANAPSGYLSSKTDPFLPLGDGTERPPTASAAAVATLVPLPPYSNAPNSLITEQTLTANGWHRARAGWIVEAAHPLTAAQIRAARRVAAAQGLQIETRDTQDYLATIRNIATLAGSLLAVAIVAMALGLIRSEAGRDLQTLTAVGASRRTRRALTAFTAAGLAIPGALLGVIGAYLTLIAAYHSHLDKLLPIPVTQLVALLVGVPALATVVGWLMAGFEPRTFARRTLD